MKAAIVAVASALTQEAGADRLTDTPASSGSATGRVETEGRAPLKPDAPLM